MVQSSISSSRFSVLRQPGQDKKLRCSLFCPPATAPSRNPMAQSTIGKSEHLYFTYASVGSKIQLFYFILKFNGTLSLLSTGLSRGNGMAAMCIQSSTVWFKKLELSFLNESLYYPSFWAKLLVLSFS